MTWRMWPPALLLVISLFVAQPRSAAASCPDLEMVQVEAGAVVFIGEVLAWEGRRTDVAVVAWYEGLDPTERAVVVGGRVGGGRESSADWRPATGERYAVIAERRDDGVFVTDLCLQGRATPPLLALLEARYGPPGLPPFAAAPTPTPTPTPSAHASEPPRTPTTEPTPIVPTQSPFPESTPVPPETDAGPPTSSAAADTLASAAAGVMVVALVLLAGVYARRRIAPRSH